MFFDTRRVTRLIWKGKFVLVIKFWHASYKWVESSVKQACNAPSLYFCVFSIPIFPICTFSQFLTRLIWWRGRVISWARVQCPVPLLPSFLNLYFSTFSSCIFSLNFLRESYEGVEESSVGHACNAPSVSLLSLLLKLNLAQGDASCSQPLSVKLILKYCSMPNCLRQHFHVRLVYWRRGTWEHFWFEIVFVFLFWLSLSLFVLWVTVCVTSYDMTMHWGIIKTVAKFQ